MLLLLACACLACEESPTDADWFERLGPLETIAGRGSEDREGQSLWQAAFEGMPATLVELSRPHAAMADAEGRIYIADKDAHAIRRVGNDGRIVTVAGTSLPGDDGDSPGLATQRRLHSPNGLWVRSDGVFYVLDLGNAAVRRVGTDGVMSTLFRVAQGIDQGRGLWVSEDEQLAYLSAQQQLLRWTPSGGVRVHASGFVELGAVLPDLDGRILVADRGAHQVYRLSFDGREREPIAGTGSNDGRRSQLALNTSLAGVRALWVCEDGRILLGTHEGSQVWRLERSGLISLLIDGEPGAHAGDGESLSSLGKKLSEVRFLSVTPSGDLLITENDFGFVRRAQLKR
ncbi:MAG: hypothetical protein RBU37_12835 [Myxococcota bacterium]|nr:hypothetical protein [Myxococcota bacterium]